MRQMALFFIALTLAFPAGAQIQAYGEPAEPSPFTFNIGGGPSFIPGDAGEVFEAGGMFQIGGGYRFSPEGAVQLVYTWSRYDVEERLIEDATIDAYHTLQYLSAEAVYEPVIGATGPVSFYVLGGPGLYYRVATVREFTGTAVQPYCDPWLFYCYPTAVETSRVLGTRDDWNFGLAGGLGVVFRLSPTAGIFVEGRYHYVWGDTFTDNEGRERSSDTQYIPVIGGFRF